MTTKQLLVFGDKTFKITVPANAKITFGPWSPPTKTNNYGGDREALKGTLRVYQGTKDNIIACFAGVTGFRDLSMQYAEQVAREEGAVIWKDDEKGYQREEKVTRAAAWVENPEVTRLPKPKKGKSRRTSHDDDIAF
jgi:hypothetical protein